MNLLNAPVVGRKLHGLLPDFAHPPMRVPVKYKLRRGFSCLALFMHGNRPNSPKEVQKHEES